MSIRRKLIIVIGASAVLIPIALATSVPPAGATRVPEPTGTVTCVVGGNLSFNPPLIPGNGTPQATTVEIVSINVSLSGCTGSSNPPGLVPTGGTVVTKPLKFRATRIGHTAYADGCAPFAAAASSKTIKSTVTWNNGIKDTKATFGFTATGTAIKSFAGKAVATLFFDGNSENDMTSCVAGGYASRTNPYGGPISRLTFDSLTSMISFGPAASLPVADVSSYASGGDFFTPINTITNTAAAPSGIISGNAARLIAIAPDGATAYVAGTNSGSVTPVFRATETGGPPVSIGGIPDGVAISPNGATAYVTNLNSANVTPINVASNTAGSPISAGGGTVGIAITPDGTRAFVTNVFANTVTPIVLASNTAGAPIVVGRQPVDIAITPDGTTAYVTNNEDNTVTPINLASNTADAPIPVGSEPQGIAITPDGKTAYVTDLGSNTVTPVNISTNTAGTAITVGNGPLGIAITPNGATVYVANTKDNTISPIDTVANTAGAPIMGFFNNPTSVAIH